ncbi:MAG: hypothetical protein IKT98_03950 [Selenomonadaceae bacterium]|nr:hypothetical protein [Selenomonadaceae bacterium]
MDFTYTLSVQHNIPLFDIMERDKDRVIMLINYFIEKGKKPQITGAPQKRKATRPHKNDGFWDF